MKIDFPFRSYPTGNKIFKKKKEEKSKNQIITLGLHFKAKQFGKGQERERIKIIISFRSYRTRDRKFQKYSTKILKIKKIPLWLHFTPKLDGKGRLKKENKNFRSVP